MFVNASVVFRRWHRGYLALTLHVVDPSSISGTACFPEQSPNTERAPEYHWDAHPPSPKVH